MQTHGSRTFGAMLSTYRVYAEKHVMALKNADISRNRIVYKVLMERHTLLLRTGVHIRELKAFTGIATIGHNLVSHAAKTRVRAYSVIKRRTLSALCTVYNTITT